MNVYNEIWFSKLVNGPTYFSRVANSRSGTLDLFLKTDLDICLLLQELYCTIKQLTKDFEMLLVSFHGMWHALPTKILNPPYPQDI